MPSRKNSTYTSETLQMSSIYWIGMGLVGTALVFAFMAPFFVLDCEEFSCESLFSEID